MPSLWFVWEKNTQRIPRKTKMAPSKGTHLKCILSLPCCPRVASCAQWLTGCCFHRWFISIFPRTHRSRRFSRIRRLPRTQGDAGHYRRSRTQEYILPSGIASGEVQYIMTGTTQKSCRLRSFLPFATQILQFPAQTPCCQHGKSLRDKSPASRVRDFWDFSSCGFILLPNCDILWVEGEN